MKRIMVLGMLLGSSLLYASNEVYIVPNGKVYHSKKYCKTLSRSKNIQEINIKNVGSRRPCKVC